jgi:hypothetical protein
MRPLFLQVELYQAGRRPVFTRSYIMTYGTSLEHQRFLSSVVVERGAFERLISTKASMALSLDLVGIMGEWLPL